MLRPPRSGGPGASSNGSQRLAPAGRRHGGTGRENNALPTSRRNSLCGGLWVSASPDFIRRWDPDVRLSGAAFLVRAAQRSECSTNSEVDFLTGTKLMAETIRGDEGGIRSVWMCLTCLTGEDPPGGHCRGLLPGFGELFLFLGRSHLLIPKEVLQQEEFQRRPNEARRRFLLQLPVL